MTDEQRIARLEALLSRVRSRSLAPREPQILPDDIAPTTEAQPAPRERSPFPVPTAPASSPFGLPAIPPQVPRPAASLFTTTLVSPPRPSPAAPPAPSPAPPPVVASPPMDLVSDVYAPPADTEFDLPKVELRESRQRLIASEPIDDEAPHIEEVSSAMMAADEADQLEAGESEYLSDGDLEVTEGEPEDDSEPAPSSSRRPTGPEPVEQLDKEIFAKPEDVIEPPPRHTPPPDSGKLPKASEHPPTIEDFEVGDVTGVHAAPLNEKRVEAPIEPMMEDVFERSGEHLAMEAPQGDLSPEVTHAVLADSRDVAQFVGDAQRFAPATFGDLLDATLSL